MGFFLSMVVHVYNPITWEVEARRSLDILEQLKIFKNAFLTKNAIINIA